MQTRRASGSVVFALAVGVLGLGSTNCNTSSTPGQAPSNLAYSTNPAIYTVGVSITNNTPTSSGGAVTSYSVAPALPAGLRLDTVSGVISGTPTAVSPTAAYTVTATNAAGSTTASLTLTVNAALSPPSNLAYTTNPAVYTVGVAIATNTPSSSGGAVVSYSVAPALPAGLSLDGAKGTISGTPTAITAQATYIVTATNPKGSTTASLVITVNDAAPTNLTYTANPATYTVGTTITTNSPSSGGGTVVSYSVSPALPAGLNFNTSTGVITGTPTAITAQATYTVTATNTGGTATASLVISVNDLAPTNLTYATNPAVYSVGTAVAGNMPSNGGGAVASYSVTPALPAGLALNGTTGVISGTPTAITALAVYTVKATNSGGSTTVGVTITVNDAAPSAVTYTLNPAVYVKGTAIAANTPTVTGGTATAYTVTPALPAGLSFNGSTGVIGGTPTAITATGTYVVKASNVTGSANANLVITVNDAAPTGITYSANPAVYAKGTPIAANTPTVTGGTPTAYTVTPALPAGLALAGATGIITGTPTAVTATAVYAIKGANITGSFTVNVTITVNDGAPTGITYSANPAVYVKGTAITANTPTVTGGTPTAYTVTPALPAGLALDGTTGIITGTPTAITALAVYAVKGANITGSFTANVTITVNDAAPTGITYSTNPAVYVKGTAIAANTPTVTGGTPTAYTVTPALPAGLALDGTTGIISGTPTAIAALAVYAIKGANITGSFTVNVTITVNDAAPTGITYSTNPAVYVKGTSITANTPTVTGGTPTAYTVTPALPAGLALAGATGIITGTPTAVTATAVYAIKGANITGSFTVNVTITVNDAAPSGITYSANPAVYVKGTPIAANTPTVTGGTATAFTVTPALPAGLTLAGATGIITGTPTAITALGTYVVKASNVSGSATVNLVITVNDAQPANLTYSANPAVYTVGSAIPHNVPSSTGGAVVSYAVAPALPAGLSLNISTGVISGTPTAATAQAIYAVTATNSGGSTQANLSITVNALLPTRFAYAVNRNDNTLSAFTVAASTGDLRADGYATTGALPRSVVVTPAGAYAYVANVTSNDISGYSVDATTGALTSLGPTVSAGAGSAPVSVAIDPAGKYLFAANSGTGNVAAFTISGSGALTAVPGSPFTATTGPVSVAVDPTGRFVYVAGSTDIAAFSIGTGGVLTSLGSVAPGGTLSALAVEPTGSYVYAVTSAEIAICIIGTNGALTVTGSTPNAGNSAVAVDTSGKYLYVANAGSNAITAYTIGSGGALTALGSPVTGASPTALAVDPSGGYLYVADFQTAQVSVYTLTAGAVGSSAIQTMSARAGTTALALVQGATAVKYVPKAVYAANNGSSNLSTYTIGSGGTLTALGAAINIGGNPVAVAVDPYGRFVYVANKGTNDVSGFTVASNGALTTVGATVSTGAGTSPNGIAVDPSGRFVYTANINTGDVSLLSINQTSGVLTLVGTNVASGSSPASVTVDPTGRFAFVANASGASVAAFTINPSTGALTIVGSTNASAGNGPVSVSVEPTGRWLYVANNGDGNVQQFSIASTGALTSVNTFTTGTQPESVAIDPLGRFLYAVNNAGLTGNSVSGFTLSEANGGLTTVGAAATTGTLPYSVAIDPTGAYAYVANYTDNNVQAYSIAQGTGVLTSLGTTTAVPGTNPHGVATLGFIQ